MQHLLLLVLLALLMTMCRAGDGRPRHKAAPTFDENYLVGMRAYTQEDWATCTEKMQQAVKDFEKYQAGSAKCLKLCESQQASCIV